MMKKVNDITNTTGQDPILGLMIIKDGITIFSEFFSPIIRTDIDLTSALLSAIESFASEASGTQLEILKFKDFNIYIQKQHDVGFILFSDPTTKENILKTTGKNIIDAFFSHFTVDDLHKHAYRPKYFERFSTILKEQLAISTRHVTRPLTFLLEYQYKDDQFKFIDLFHAKEELDPLWEVILEVMRTFISHGGYLTWKRRCLFPHIFSVPRANAVVYFQGAISEAGIAAKRGDVLILGLVLPLNYFEALYFYYPIMGKQGHEILGELFAAYRAFFSNDDLHVLSRAKKLKMKLDPIIHEWSNLMTKITENTQILSWFREHQHSNNKQRHESKNNEMHALVTKDLSLFKAMVISALTLHHTVVVGREEEVKAYLLDFHELTGIPSIIPWSQTSKERVTILGQPHENEIYHLDSGTMIINLTTSEIKTTPKTLPPTEHWHIHAISELIDGLEFKPELARRKWQEFIKDWMNTIIHYLDVTALENDGTLAQELARQRENEQTLLLNVIQKLNPLISWSLQRHLNPKTKEKHYFNSLRNLSKNYFSK